MVVGAVMGEVQGVGDGRTKKKFADLVDSICILRFR